MPANPTISAQLKYGSTNIITISNPVYSGGILTWSGTLASDVTVAAEEFVDLVITTTQSGVEFTIEYDSQTKPSRIEIPTSTYVDIESFGVYDV